MPRWIFFIFAILAGIGLGLLYGWVISPVEYVDTSPDSLRADFKADYTLMVSEAYESEQDVEQAARRMALLGSLPPAELASQSLDFARSQGYSSDDQILMQNLVNALQSWQEQP